MVKGKKLFLSFLLSCTVQVVYALPLAEQFKHRGYVEICDTEQTAATFDALYACFDEFIAFLQTNPRWAQKLYGAKERFIRSKDRTYYSTDFFGFYDESERAGRRQIAFYYATHFHQFMCVHSAECNQVPEISRFLKACHEIQKPYASVFNEAAVELGIETIFSSSGGEAPLLLKVIKYLPTYHTTKPHYDGTALSLFLDSTDNQSLLLAPYKSSLTTDDFYAPVRTFSRSDTQHSILLIPGLLLTEFALYPTPHIVAHSGTVRYATIAFAMRPDYVQEKIELNPLPNFAIE